KAAGQFDGHVGDGAGVLQLARLQGLDEVRHLRATEVYAAADHARQTGHGEGHTVVFADERIHLDTEADIVRPRGLVLNQVADQDRVEQALLHATDVHRLLAWDDAQGLRHLDDAVAQPDVLGCLEWLIAERRPLQPLARDPEGLIPTIHPQDGRVR